jgi:trigger factor
MNVSRINIDDLNAVLKVEVVAADYMNKWNATIEKYRKTAKIPGFRPGHVPVGLIKKQYGKAALADELNKLVNDTLFNYIKDNNIEVLGNPIPKEGTDVKGDFDQPDSFEFEYEIGLSPVIQLDLSTKNTFDYNLIDVDDKLIDKQIEDLRRRYGKLSNADEITGNEMLMVQLEELNSENEIKEEGISNSSTISLEFLQDEKVKGLFSGKKIGDTVTVNPAEISKGVSDMAAILGVKEDDLEGVSESFRVTINEIKRMEMAELNQELFDKLFGPESVNSENELRDRIKFDLENMFSNDSERLFTQTVYNHIMETTDLSLPDAFLKRWISLSNEKKITTEQIEAEYDAYAKGLKWQLIQGFIFKSNDIQLNNEEVIEYTKGLLVSNYVQYGIPAPDDKELTDSALRVLSNKEEANRIYDMIAEKKLTTYFKETVKMNEKKVSYDDFVAMASK